MSPFQAYYERRGKMARGKLLTPQLLQRIEKLLEIGCTVEVACQQVGITRATFYNWKTESARMCQRADARGNAFVLLDDVPILTFLDTVTRAQTRAQAVATASLFSAMLGTSRVVEEPFTYRETRFYKAKDGTETPYVYEETRFREVVQVVPPDWRAGLEYLKRRDPATWNPPTKIEVTWQDQAVADIRAGAITYQALAEAFDDDLAAELFARAGVPLPVTEGARA